MESPFAEAVRSCVSRETFESLQRYVSILEKWNVRINLVSRSTTNAIWDRHITDSLQLSKFQQDATTWVDLGSGAGLPGLIVAADRQDNPNFRMTLVESDQRKCAFMAAAAEVMGINVDIQCRRIEEEPLSTFDVVSARALAPLDQLLHYAEPYRSKNAICLFPKGAKALEELTKARESFHMKSRSVPSITDSNATIICVEEYSFV